MVGMSDLIGTGVVLIGTGVDRYRCCVDRYRCCVDRGLVIDFALDFGHSYTAV